MANVTISQLPAADTLTGTELVPVVQDGVTVRTTTAAIAASPSLTQTFLTVNNEPTLANSRYFSVGTGLGLTDNGAQSNLVLSLNGASGSLETAGNGFAVKTGLTTVVGRSLTTSGAGLTVTNGSGVSGNPVFSLSGLPASLAAMGGTGILGVVGGSSITSFLILGTASQIDVANGAGPSDPTISIANNAVFPGTGGVVVPNGTTAQQPVGTDGQVRYNTTSQRFEGFQNGSWVNFGNGDGSVTYVYGTANEITVSSPTTTPIIALATNPVLPGSGSVTVPAGNTAARPGLAVNGMLRYNSQTATFEGYANNAWGSITTGTGVTSVDASGGTTGMSFSGGPITSTGTLTLNGTLITSNGGTGLTSYTTGDILYYSAGTALNKLAIGTNGQILTSSGSIPQWSTLSGVAVTTFSAGTTGFSPNVATAGAITLSGTLNVANGGTGATTLTGYVKGNGTSAFTAAATIPNTDITGLGTMSTQNANSVAITGGNINGTTIGNTTPAAGTFTSVAMTSGTITTTPASGTDIVNKTYADSIAAGINFHQSCRLATAAALPACTYNNGTSGVGATLTANANGALSVDGTAVVLTNRILVKNQVTQSQNGVYTVTQVGDGSTPFILTRATDFDTPGTGVNQIDAGDFFLITAGATLANTSWVQQTPLPITVGSTAIVFQQFGTPITYSAGTGLSESPTYTFNIANTGVTATTYGSASSVPVIGVNAQGQITSASNSSIAIGASQITSGQLAIANGGTNGTATPTAGAVPYGTGTAYAFSLAGTSSQVLLSGGASTPTWADQSSLSVGSATTATTATNVAGGAGGSVLYQSAASTTTSLAIGSADTILTSSGSLPQWTAPSGISVGTATNLAGGTAGAIAYQTGAGATTFLSLGTSTYVLTAGASAPAYVAQSTLSVGSATSATNATNTAITDDTTTNATMYPTWVTANTGNLPQKVTSTKLTFNPSTGALNATGGISGGTF